MEIFKIASGAKIIIDYAHTPDAYEKVLFNIKELNPDFKKFMFSLAQEVTEMNQKER